MLSRLSREYYFLSMRKVVKDVVLLCDICIRNKALHYALYRLIKLLTISPYLWKSIALDFVIKLLPSKDLAIGIVYNLIYIIMDKFIKYTYMVPVLET